MMRDTGFRFSLGLVALVLSGCSLIFDGARHRGAEEPSDGGVDASADAAPGDDGGDEDDAGPTPDPCALPPTARCGEPLDEICPPLQHTQLATVFGAHTALGQLRPTVVWEGEERLGPRLALAAVEHEGELHGKSSLFLMERNGSAFRPVRLDVPLHDLSAGEAISLSYTQGEETLEVAEVTSFAVARESSAGSVVGMLLMNSAGGELFRGYGDLVTLQSSLTRATTSDEYLDDVVALTGAYVVRVDEGAGVNRLYGGYNTSGSGPPLPFVDVTTGVPSAAGLRALTAGGGQQSRFLFQNGEGSFWSADVDGFASRAPVLFERTGQSGAAAWEKLGADDRYVLIYHMGGSVYFEPFECLEDCEEAPSTGNFSSFSTIAPTGEVPGAARMPSGRLAVLVVERYASGDRLVLQFTDDDSSFTISLGRIPLLDLRGSGERVADAVIRHVETSFATTLVVAATVGDGVVAPNRVVMTGVRGCAAP